MPVLRSRPVAIKPVRLRTGNVTYRVTGTIGKRQRKIFTTDQEQALAIQTDWELERTLSAAAIRSKATRLRQEELTQAEAAFEMLKGTGQTVLDAVRHFLRNPPSKRIEKTLDQGYQEFLREKSGHVSDRQLENHRSALSRFSAFVGPLILADVTADKITSWLKSLNCSKKSWNLYRSSIGAFFNWATKDPRNWIEGTPVGGVVAYRKCETLSDELPQRLTVEKSQMLMRYLEENMPHWVTFFAVTLFIGVRPEGEVSKLAEAIERDGVDRYVREGKLFLTAKITKDRRPRTVPLPHNLVEWVARYPLTPKALRAGSRDQYAQIRALFSLPHDGLRHTSISASVSFHGISEAAFHHGTSERIIRAHYLALMSRPEAEAFYDILPTTCVPAAT